MATACDELFSILADPTRQAMFERLSRQGEQNVQTLSAWCATGARDARPTTLPRPQGLMPLIGWMSLYGAFWRDRFDRFETLLHRMEQ